MSVTRRAAAGSSGTAQLFPDSIEQLVKRVDWARSDLGRAYRLWISRNALGEHEPALDELERLTAEGSPQSCILAPEPFSDPLRAQPRFDAVLEELSLPRLAF